MFSSSSLILLLLLLIISAADLISAGISPITSLGEFPSSAQIGSSLLFSDCTDSSNCNSLPEANSKEFLQNTTRPGFFISSSPLGVGLLRVTFETVSPSSAFLPTPCSADTGKTLPHQREQDSAVTGKTRTTTILPFYPLCFLNLSSSSASWLPREKWCSFGNSNQQLAAVKSDIFDFLAEIQAHTTATAPIRAMLPLEYSKRISQYPQLQFAQTRESNNILLAAEKLSDLAICGSLSSNSSENQVSISVEVFTLKQTIVIPRTGPIERTFESKSYPELSTSTTTNAIQFVAGLPAKLDLVSSSTKMASSASSSSTQASWCAISKDDKEEKEEIRMAFDIPLTVSALEMQVTDSWGNPCVVDATATTTNNSVAAAAAAMAQVTEILTSIRLSVSVSSSSMNSFPSNVASSSSSLLAKAKDVFGVNTRSSSGSAIDQYAANIFCINENRHLWSFNSTTSSVKISRFSISLCPGVAQKLLAMTTSMRSSSLDIRTSDASSRLPVNILLSRLASGVAVKLRLGLKSTFSQQSATQLVPLSNGLRNCLLKGFYIQASRADSVTIVPSSVLPWHVQSIVLESSTREKNNNNDNNNDNNNMATQQDPFTATWGTLGMTERLSQSFAWVRAACVFCSPLATISSSASSQLRHFSVSIAQDEFVFSSDDLLLPDQLVFNTEIFLTDSQGIIVRDRSRVVIFASATDDPRCTTSGSFNQSGEVNDIWCVSCEAIVNEDESEDDDYSLRGSNTDILPERIQVGKVRMINESVFDASLSSTSLSSDSSITLPVIGRWTPFPSSTTSDGVRAQVQFVIPLVRDVDVQSRSQQKSGLNTRQTPFSFKKDDYSVRVQCRAIPVRGRQQRWRTSGVESSDIIESAAIFHLQAIGDYECSDLRTASDVASSLSSLDVEAIRALVRSVAEDTSSVSLAASISPPLVQVFLPSAIAVESELALDSVRNDGTATVPGGYLVDTQTASSSSTAINSPEIRSRIRLRNAYDPRIGVPWFPETGLTSWVLIPRTSYLNIPLGIMTSMAFGTSYAVTRRIVLALKRPVCSRSVGKLQTAMSDWVYILANNLTNTMTHSTVLGQGTSLPVQTSSSSSTSDEMMGGNNKNINGNNFLIEKEDVAPRQSSFTLQTSATGARQMTTWTSCYGRGVDNLEFVALQCCQNNAEFQLLLRESTPSQQKQEFFRTGGSIFNRLVAVNALWSATVDEAVFSSESGETKCGIYVLGTLGPAMLAGAGVGGVLASIGICFYIWLLLSRSTTEMKTWAEMTVVEQWRVIILHLIAPWIPGVHAYYNFGSTTFTATMVFWVDMGFFLFWYFGVLVHAVGRLISGAGKTKGWAFRLSRWIYNLGMILLLAYSHFLVVNAFLWIAASIHINLALVPYLVGYAVIAIQMWFSVQCLASELEPSLITGRYPTVTMAPIDCALWCEYFVIIVTVFMGFVSQVDGLTPFMGVAAAFVVFLLLLLYNFAPGESLRLAVQQQLEGQEGDNNNKGSKLTDFLQAMMGNQAIDHDDEDDEDDGDYDGDFGGGANDQVGGAAAAVADENLHDDEEMRDLSPKETPLLHHHHHSNHRRSHQHRSSIASNHQKPQQQQQQNSNNNNTNGLPIDPELAAKLVTTVPKLVALANGGKGGNVNANDLLNAMKLVGALQQLGGGGGNAATAVAANNPSLAALQVAASLAQQQQGGGGGGGGSRKIGGTDQDKAISAGLNVATSLASGNTAALNADDLTVLLQAMSAVQQQPLPPPSSSAATSPRSPPGSADRRNNNNNVSSGVSPRNVRSRGVNNDNNSFDSFFTNNNANGSFTTNSNGSFAVPTNSSIPNNNNNNSPSSTSNTGNLRARSFSSNRRSGGGNNLRNSSSLVQNQSFVANGGDLEGLI